MAISNTKVFGKHFDRDISDIFFDEYNEYQREYESIAKVENAPTGNHYTEAELSPFGALREIPEGTGIQFDLPVEGNEKTIYYTKFGLGAIFTEEMMQDDITGNFKKVPKKLAKSASYKPDAEFFDMFNNGFTTTYHTAWDAKAIFAADHATLKSGQTVGNEPSVAATPSETSLQEMFEYFDGLVDEAGFPITMYPRKILVPTELRWSIGKLHKQEKVIGSANNDLNTVNTQNKLVDGWDYMVSRNLTSATAWFALSDEHDFRIYWKWKTKAETGDDFYTGNALFKVTQRFAVFCMNPRGAWGNPGA